MALTKRIPHTLQGPWYHGGPRRKHIRGGERFADQEWDRDRSTQTLNAEGPGIYWTTSPGEAEGYAGRDGVVYVGHLRSDFRLATDTTSTTDLRDLVTQFIDRAPQEYVIGLLENHGVETDTDDTNAAAEHVAQGLKTIITSYAVSDILHTLVYLYHDLLNYDASTYIDIVTGIGLDGIILEKKQSLHLVLWNRLGITEVEEYTGMKEEEEE